MNTHQDIDAPAGMIPARHPQAAVPGPAPDADQRPDEEGARPVSRALRRGWRERCPRCGGGNVFDGYLNVRDECMVCAQPLFHHRADDMPAWITITVVGHLVVPMLVLVNDLWAPPMWVHMVTWPTMVLGLTLLLLPRFKAMVVALQWATRMGGFGADEKRPA
jgi:uncharacterized protein (DUF983 family)